MSIRKRIIAIAEDDRDDRELTREAFAQVDATQSLTFFNDGAELMQYLHDHLDADDRDNRLPSMVLMDLNMPRVDGRQALQQIRADVRLRHLSVVVMSTSRSEHDIRESYVSGANSYITKPPRFQGLVDALRSLDSYWFKVASLPD